MIEYLQAVFTSLVFFPQDFIYLFSERGEGREKERERNINVWLPLTYPLLETWPATQACALTRNPTSNRLVHRAAPNPLSNTSQDIHIFVFLCSSFIARLVICCECQHDFSWLGLCT